MLERAVQLEDRDDHENDREFYQEVLITRSCEKTLVQMPMPPPATDFDECLEKGAD